MRSCDQTLRAVLAVLAQFEVREGELLMGKVTNIFGDRVWVDIGLVKDGSCWASTSKANWLSCFVMIIFFSFVCVCVFHPKPSICLFDTFVLPKSVAWLIRQSLQSSWRIKDGIVL